MPEMKAKERLNMIGLAKKGLEGLEKNAYGLEILQTGPGMAGKEWPGMAGKEWPGMAGKEWPGMAGK